MSEPVVLVVEDNERNRKLVRDVLVHAGMQVLEATSAEDGVVVAARERPDLVLMDLQLPGMDGYAGLEALRGSPDTQRIPVVAVTAFAMDDDRARVLRAGFEGYLQKPISVRELPDQVRGFVRTDVDG